MDNKLAEYIIHINIGRYEGTEGIREEHRVYSYSKYMYTPADLLEAMYDTRKRLEKEGIFDD